MWMRRASHSIDDLPHKSAVKKTDHHTTLKRVLLSRISCIIHDSIILKSVLFNYPNEKYVVYWSQIFLTTKKKDTKLSQKQPKQPVAVQYPCTSTQLLFYHSFLSLRSWRTFIFSINIRLIFYQPQLQRR